MNKQVKAVRTTDSDHVFNKIFNRVDKVLAFDPRYANNTGYLDGLVKLVQLNQGEILKMIDDLGRKAIIVGTLFGPIVIFERYAVILDGDVQRYIKNCPPELSKYGFVTSNNLVEYQEMCHVLNYTESDLNLGQKILKLTQSKQMMKVINDLQRAKPIEEVKTSLE